MLLSLRRLAALLAIILAVAGLSAGPAATAQPQRAPTVAARAAVLVDAGTGAVLWQRNAHTPMLAASTTKILTALVAEAAYPPAQLFTVPLAAEQVDGTRFGYKIGMRIRRHDLLATLLMVSANDAAETLAAAYPRGGRAGFLHAMQAMAESLGCTDSTWRSPSGLEVPGHRASAADLAIAGRQLLTEPELAQLVRARTARYRWPDGRVQVITNHNHFVADGREPGAIGVKTGYTDAAGRTIVAAERHAGRTLIAVALGMPDRRAEQDDVRSMFTYGFAAQPRPGAEILGAAAAARREASSAPPTSSADQPARDGLTPGAPAAVAHTGPASRLLAEPAAAAVGGGMFVLVLGILTVIVLRPRRGRPAAVPAKGRSRVAGRATGGAQAPCRLNGDTEAPGRVRSGRVPVAGRYEDREP